MKNPRIRWVFPRIRRVFPSPGGGQDEKYLEGFSADLSLEFGGFTFELEGFFPDFTLELEDFYLELEV